MQIYLKEIYQTEIARWLNAQYSSNVSGFLKAVANWWGEVSFEQILIPSLQNWKLYICLNYTKQQGATQSSYFTSMWIIAFKFHYTVNKSQKVQSSRRPSLLLFPVTYNCASLPGLPNQTVRRNENTVTQSRHLIYLRNITRIEARSAILVRDRTTEWSLEIQKRSAHVSNKLWFDLLMNEKKFLHFYNFTDLIYGVILYQYVNYKSLQTNRDKFW